MTTNIRVNFGGMNKWERCKTDTQFMWRKPLHSDGPSNHLMNGSIPNPPKTPRGGSAIRYRTDEVSRIRYPFKGDFKL